MNCQSVRPCADWSATNTRDADRDEHADDRQRSQTGCVAKQ